MKLPGSLVASCYCIRKGLIRKAHLAHNLRKVEYHDPDFLKFSWQEACPLQGVTVKFMARYSAAFFEFNDIKFKLQIEIE